MKSRWTPIAVLAWMACGPLLGDVVIPSERVTSGVNIREHPTAQSQIIGALTPAMKLEYVGSIPRWNEVRLSDGTAGFVSKSWTHVVASGPAGDYRLDVVDVGTVEHVWDSGAKNEICGYRSAYSENPSAD